MKKQKMACVLAVVLGIMLVCGSALAESWTCYQCGQVNNGTFCSSCGAKKPMTGVGDLIAQPIGGEISDVEVTARPNGDVVVTWSDSSDSGPYVVLYSTDNWTVNYYDQESYSGKKATLQLLVPGAVYEITVSNGSSEETVAFKAPMNVFTEFSTRKRYLKMVSEGSVVESFSLLALEKDPTAMFEMRLGHPSLVKDREYDTARLALKTPYGYCSKVNYWSPFTLKKGNDAYFYWNESIHEWLNRVEKDFGSVPTGEYSFEMFVDNEIYAYISFRVNR